MFDPIFDDDADDAFDLEADLNEAEELDGLILSMRDADGAAVYRLN